MWICETDSEFNVNLRTRKWIQSEFEKKKVNWKWISKIINVFDVIRETDSEF